MSPPRGFRPTNAKSQAFIEEALHLYQTGLDQRAVASQLGVSKSAVGNWLRKRGIPTHRAAEARDVRAVELYRSGLSMTQVAQELHAAVQTVFVWLHQHGVDTSRGRLLPMRRCPCGVEFRPDDVLRARCPDCAAKRKGRCRECGARIAARSKVCRRCWVPTYYGRPKELRILSCSECGETFATKQNNRKYCSWACKQIVKERLRLHRVGRLPDPDWLEQAVALFKSGLTFAEISQTVGASTSTVRNWCDALHLRREALPHRLRGPRASPRDFWIMASMDRILPELERSQPEPLVFELLEVMRARRLPLRFAAREIGTTRPALLRLFGWQGYLPPRKRSDNLLGNFRLIPGLARFLVGESAPGPVLEQKISDLWRDLLPQRERPSSAGLFILRHLSSTRTSATTLQRRAHLSDKLFRKLFYRGLATAETIQLMAIALPLGSVEAKELEQRLEQVLPSDDREMAKLEGIRALRKGRELGQRVANQNSHERAFKKIAAAERQLERDGGRISQRSLARESKVHWSVVKDYWNLTRRSQLE